MITHTYHFPCGSRMEVHNHPPMLNPKDLDRLGILLSKDLSSSVSDATSEYGSVLDITPHEFAVCLPLYLDGEGDLSDVSSNTLRVGVARSSWDEKQWGWILVTSDRIQDVFGDIQQENLEMAKLQLLDEVYACDLFLHQPSFGLRFYTCFLYTSQSQRH